MMLWVPWSEVQCLQCSGSFLQRYSVYDVLCPVYRGIVFMMLWAPWSEVLLIHSTEVQCSRCFGFYGQRYSVYDALVLMFRVTMFMMIWVLSIRRASVLDLLSRLLWASTSGQCLRVCGSHLLWFSVLDALDSIY
jgi:hypothetical protein